MAGHPPYLSVTKTLIRINAAAVEEYLPGDVDPERHGMTFDVDADDGRVYIEFVEGVGGSDVYSINVKESGYHASASQVRKQILDEYGVGRYDCWWDDDAGCLVADLTTEVMEPQNRFRWKPS
ncbi:hypothetical protein BDK61_1456 [Haloarcula quadrata]|uniref:Uncharacterized protein n=1 Tax=Haloarcula quadrata TaxID=182779 RepID=A0A495R4A2_9EURY|nr:hypothetical protein [Haloarcula quadrata]RKS82157.1 hypothetical protein BDK61_1456 [Haloarcula quadrata]